MQQASVAPGLPDDGPSPKASTSSSPAASDFAGLLAALTASAPRSEPAWNDSALADDVATLSYEQALRTHAPRYKAANADDRALTQVPDSEPMRKFMQERSAFASQAAKQRETREWSDGTELKSPPALSTGLERNRKCASITIRLSKEECEQLKKRAAEAGLTISAYLRSCTFEVEALRAQVKEALAQLRPSDAPPQPKTAATVHHSWFGTLRRLVPGSHSSQSVARA